MRKCNNCGEDCSKGAKCRLFVPIAMQLLESERKTKGFVDVMTKFGLKITTRGNNFFIEKGA